VKALSLLKKILTHRYVALVLRLYVGALFIYASMYKINYTGEFAETIASYQIVPYWTVNILGVVLPWVELICGILLVAGIRARSATVVIGFLMILFGLAIMINLMKDSPISCGCFHTVGEKISWWTLLRDLIWVIMTIHILFYDKAFHLEKRFSLTLKEV
jgi:putative oxidoreductase